MSQIIVLKVAGSSSFTIVDRAKGTVEEVDGADVTRLLPDVPEMRFFGVQEAYVVHELTEISSRKHCVAA